MKATVYIETTIVGHLTSRIPGDPVTAAQMLQTRDWWDQHRASFDCYTSEAVLIEASRGDAEAANERLKLLSTLPLLSVKAEVDSLTELLLIRGALPEKARLDAIHLAIATTSGMSYLLTWNCRHLANATLRGKIERACYDSGFEPPVICTPTELLELEP